MPQQRDGDPSVGDDEIARLRFALLLVVLLALAAGLFEILVGRATKSSNLVWTGVDWGYDAAIYAVGLVAVGRGALAETRAGYAMAAILAVATGNLAYSFLQDPKGLKDSNEVISLDDIVTLVVSFGTVALLMRFRGSSHTVARAAYFASLASLGPDVFDVLSGIAIAAFAPTWVGMLNKLLGIALTAAAAWATWRETRKT